MPRAARRAIAALLLCSGCVAAGGPAAPAPAPGGSPSGPAAAVPFIPQQEETCGPTSVAMLLRQHGRPADVDELVRETRTAGLRGTLITDLAAAARRRGLAAEVAELDLAGLRRRLLAAEPVVLLLDLGTRLWSRPHYVVAFAATPEGARAHSGRTPGVLIPWERLERQWALMGHLAIVAGPGP